MIINWSVVGCISLVIALVHWDFHSENTVSSSRLSWYKRVSDDTIIFPASFSNFGLTLSGPAYFFTWIESIFCVTSFWLIVALDSDGTSHRCPVDWLVSGGGNKLLNLSPTVAKNELVAFALSSSVRARDPSSLLMGPMLFLALGLVALFNRFQ